MVLSIVCFFGNILPLQKTLASDIAIQSSIIHININTPKLLPDSPFFRLKTSWETLRIWATFNTVKKAEYRLELAHERLQEIETLAKKGAESEETLQKIQKNQERFVEQMQKVEKILKKAKSKGIDISIFEEDVQTLKTVHDEQLTSLIDTYKDKEALEKIRNTMSEQFDGMLHYIQK